MREKIRLIVIIALAAMLAISIFIGLQTYSAKKAIELERNALISENGTLARKIEEVTQERKQLQEKVNALSNDLNKTSQEKQDIQRQYELLVKERDDLIEKAKTLQKNNEQLRDDLGNLKREKQQLGQKLEENLAPIRNENAELKQQLDNLNSLKSKLEAELGQLKGEKSDLERKLNEIDSFLEQSLTGPKYTSLREQLDIIRSGGTPETRTPETRTPETRTPETQTAGPEEESVELPPIVVKPQTQAQAETPAWPKKSIPVEPTGTVLEINQENKFVIIDLGQDVGIKPGDTFKVYKQGKVVGTIEVIQARQSISACDIKEEITAIEVGDTIR